jgi:glycosyltransferase involved in cell wall biosynthesis
VKTRRICFVGLENLSVLAHEFSHRAVGGEQVQQSLLACAFARKGYDVSMVVADYGQADGATWQGVRTYKAYRLEAGLPVVRFVHPRWTGLWSALNRADADVYYYSCAGMPVGLGVMHARLHGHQAIYRIAHDNDCWPDRLQIRYWHHRKLYEYGLRGVGGILAQSASQQSALLRNYGLHSTLAGMLVEPASRQLPVEARDLPVLWVNTLREFKRPDLMLDLAASMPELAMHMIGGREAGSEALYDASARRASDLANLVFHGRVPYHDVTDWYEQARVFVNTSDSEGFPNSYLQSWMRGTPVVAFFDPDGVIAREGLGRAVKSLDEMRDAVRQFTSNPVLWLETSERCKAYMAREFSEDKVLAPYLELVESLCARVVQTRRP